MRINLRFFLKLSLILVLLLTFLFGGFIQYFLGVPNTVYSLFIFSIIYFLIVTNVLITGKIYWDKFITFCVLFFLFIFFSGIINKTEGYKIILYCIFALIPLGINYLYQIFKNIFISYKTFLNSFFRIIVIIQLPIILIQKYGFDFLIKLNNSNQSINEYDFMFGSFFIRADHSLGFFLLVYGLNILFKLKKKTLKRIPWFMLIYITITIFILESNLTKLVFIIVVFYYSVIWIYKKVNFLGIVVMALIGLLMFNIALTIPAIDAQYYFLKNRYTPKESMAAFEKGYAKRPQVVVALVTEFPIKWIGDGPYNYFNVFTGKFKQTKHFSQLIWTYNDLGIIGLLIVVLMAFFLIKSLSLERESFILFFVVFILYLFMTTVYADLAMMISIFLIKEDE